MGLKIALIQMDIAFGQPEANYNKVSERCREAVEKGGADIIVLPELWTTGYDLAALDQIGDNEGETTWSFISTLAKTYDVHIVGGSIAKKSGSHITNTMLVVDREGKRVKEYSKAHLFRLMNEEKYLIQGNDDGLFKLDGHLCAGVICYDIRFPEWIRTHMLQNTKVLFVVAEWPESRIDHWRALLVSRAIENQCIVVACNRVGSDPNNAFGGNSMIIGPWGNVIKEAGNEETILYGEVELDDVNHVRETIPVFDDRRIELYKN
ncbi:carbon-nitrogen family hydrolase [Salipaludibacillus agaradhaerens]|uniref:carbon-nitrogen family hydrolase n=1 Tax=Salipaludibacillus agaradhaerens TaxID=76935 RepID=UPI0021519D65|nr:carbon-nitrogen family hydrolase [Salipaludibacillus agaradhaerens]MCR6108316.1 carbon-nitrogen family hydrolase [Salipaludibacillus agaradhaerens]MCR6120341.1 carbon-nitrogen family hydrolase [Salipaludibacillus agaradhaerens]UJW59354.1 carbon-nitrogen family hydrolase [Bacillus sp. A116_S68]